MSPRTRNALVGAGLLIAVLVVPGCVSQAAIQALEQMKAAGTISEQQYEALMGGLQQAAVWQWVDNLITIAASVGWVRLVRGTPATPLERDLRRQQNKKKPSRP